MKKTLIYNIGQLVTMRGHGDGPIRGRHMADPEVLHDAAILIEDGIIAQIGSSAELVAQVDASVDAVDAEGSLVTPGLVDAHTHLVHGGSREHELAKKIDGVPYLEILAAGGGILNTVEATRRASFEELLAQAKRSLNTMLTFGVTTVEAKSGYGLDFETEQKQLQVTKALQAQTRQHLVSTFLGAHAVPPAYKGRVDEYVDELIGMIQQVADADLAEFCDVFCETGVFDVDQSRKILAAAKARGMKLKIHADEIDPLGGAGLAAELGATSADHLIAARDVDLAKMADSGVIPVVLPGTSWYLGKPAARARDMIDSFNLPVAVATDYNPGSCPTENLQLVMTFAGHAMKLRPLEVLCAVTRNAAYAVGRGHQAGMLDEGRPADIVIWRAKNPEYIIYHYGINLVNDVFIDGHRVVQGGALV